VRPLQSAGGGPLRVRPPVYAAYAPLEREEDSIVLEEETVSGVRFAVSLGDARFQQSFFPVRTEAGCAVFMVQDSPQPDGSTTAEAQRAREMIEESFRVSRE
jgi:hypothetical protein